MTASLSWHSRVIGGSRSCDVSCDVAEQQQVLGGVMAGRRGETTTTTMEDVCVDEDEWRGLYGAEDDNDVFVNSITHDVNRMLTSVEQRSELNCLN